MVQRIVEVFDEGRDAFSRDLPLSANPYTSLEGFDWQNGWHDAKNEYEAWQQSIDAAVAADLSFVDDGTEHF